MTDKKLTDGEIVKALEELLEIMLCEGDLQRSATISKSLDLINRQQAENEKTNIAFENLIEVARIWKEKYSNVKEELFNKNQQLKTAKAEACKEFVERLKEQAEVYTDSAEDVFILAVGISKIDNLLKELMGENND